MLLDRSPNHGLYTGSDPDLRHLLLPMALAQQARKLRTEPKGAVCPCTCLKNTRRPCPPAPRRASGQGKQTGPCSVPASARDLPEHQQRTEPSSARYQPACIRLLPRDAWSPKTPLAGRDRFHHPAPTIPPKRTSSVRFSGRPPLPRGTINCIPRAANARSSAFLPVLVPHHPLRNLLRQHEIEPPLRQSRLMRPGRTALHRNGQSPRVHRNQNLHPLAHLRASDPVASTTGRTERRVQKAFVQPILSALLHQLPRLLQQPFEYTLPHPALEGLVDSTPGAESPGQVFPFGAVIQQPENAGQSLALVDPRPAAFGILRWVRNPCAEPIQQFVGQSQHDRRLLWYRHIKLKLLE